MTSGAAALPAPTSTGAGGRARTRERALWIAVGLAVALAVAAAVLRTEANPVLAAGVLGLVLVSYQRSLLAWQSLLGLLLAVIIFIPIRRYTVAGGLPFELEPYRILVAVVLACWLCAVCADPAVRWRGTGLEAPILVVVVAILGSLVLNVSRVSSLGGFVVKQVTFLLSFFLVTYFITSVIERGRKLDLMLRLLVGGGTLLSVASLFEWRTGENLFNGLDRIMPFLHYVSVGDHVERGTGFRALGSAQHPIALGAALVMLIPLAVYLHKRDKRSVWLVCGALLTLGALSTVSRTAVVMLIVLLVTFLWIKRDETLRLLPMLIPLAIVLQVAMPGTLGTYRVILQPNYLLQEQSVNMGPGSGRIHDIGPSLREWWRAPLFGQGYGTRVTSTEIGTGGKGDPTKAQILDDQWLGWLLQVGAVGLLGLVWLFWRAVRRLAQRARSDPDLEGWLATALAASLASFAIGMLTFDAFAFVQVTFFAFAILGFGAVAVRDEPARAP